MSAAVVPFASVPNVIAVRCHFCSQQRPAFRTHQLTDSQRICDHCIEWHNKAMEFLAGGEIPGCQQCEKSFAHLRDMTLGDQVRMYVVPKDGVYQVLCPECAGTYLPKRADLFRGTKFGSEALNL